MKKLNGLIVSLLYMHLSLVNSSTIEPDCTVKDKLSLKLNDSGNFNISFYISAESKLRIQVSFVGRSETTDNDLLILEPNGGKHQHKRDDDAETDGITLNKNITLGWNTVNITVIGEEMRIGEFYTLKKFEYKVEKILIMGKYLTNCLNRTPKWKIDKSSNTKIPLTGLSSFELSLSSEEPFLPDIAINNLSIKSSFQQPLYNYHIEFLKDSDMIYILDKKIKNAPKILMSANTKENFTDLEIRSHLSDFILTLHPFQKHITKVNPASISKDPGDILHATESTTKDSPSSAWKVISAVTIVIIIVLIAVIYMVYKSKISKDSSMEEGRPLLSNDSQIPAKMKIRSENTELHGEFNPKFGYQKEICKLKLEPDQNYKYKKTLGELDEKMQTKVILVVGETGSGKSSTINGMINHIYGINYEDPFRFKLIDDMDSPTELGINTTEEITSYYIPYIPGILNDSNYIFLDTPGFGDMRGIEEDTKMVTKFYDFLKKNTDITAVDAICFVIKASETRLAKKQEYIISGLFSLFGNDVKRNIYIVVTFSDGTETHVPQLFKNSGLDFGLEMHFNVKGIFNESTEIMGLTDNELSLGFQGNWNMTMSNMDKFFQESWNMTMSTMDDFFKGLKNKTSVILTLTNIVLEENKDIIKLTDELLQLIEKEELTKDAEKQKIQERIEQNQSLLMTKLDEAKKLTGRLKNIPCKENPMAINEYIDSLISSEKEENKIAKLEKVKERNTKFQDLLKKRI